MKNIAKQYYKLTKRKKASEAYKLRWTFWISRKRNQKRVDANELL